LAIGLNAFQEKRNRLETTEMARKTYRDAQGYLRFIDSGRLVHRWAARKKLRRPLEPGEVVHHKNTIRTDNRNSNLIIFKSRKAHKAHHVKEKWVSVRRKRTLKGR
jgi:hypothetical protein